MEKQQFLMGAPLFSGLSPADGTMVINESEIKKKTLGIKETFLRPGDKLEGLIVVMSGLLRTYHVNPDGDEITHGIFGAKDILGETIVLNSGKCRYFVKAMGGATVLIVPAKILWRQIKAKPQLLVRLMSIIEKRRARLEERIEKFFYASVAKRLAQELLWLADKFGIDDGERRLIRIKITHTVLASLIGSSRETLSLTLGDMKRRGLIGVNDDRKFIIKEPDLLASYGS